MKKVVVLIAIVLINSLFIRCQTKDSFITYEVTPDFCKQIGKTKVHFTVNIPKSLNFKKPIPNKKNSSYGVVEKTDKNNLVSEMYSFGHIKMDGMAIDIAGVGFLKQIRLMLKRGGYMLEPSKIGHLTFDEKKYMSLQVAGTMEKGLSDMYKGRYLFNIIIKPNPYSNVHIVMLMAARDDQIKSYSDFADKLSISEIWKSFKYLK